MNRGSQALLLADMPEAIASMRPRFMNRGSIRARGSVHSLRTASMRPRFMNRGSYHDTVHASDGGVGFNEAPIHESGK